MIKQRYFSISQLAHYFGMNRRTMKRHLHKLGIKPAITVGHPRYDLAEVESLLRAPEHDVLKEKVEELLERIER
ncbi:hypothetical protein J7M23_01625 [Candidatus Sumerlaeota bacterium]|nr:hypothetical protein [Candidatus Sumerlaeota bacterium]